MSGNVTLKTLDGEPDGCATNIHVMNPREGPAFDDVSRVLKDGGKFQISVVTDDDCSPILLRRSDPGNGLILHTPTCLLVTSELLKTFTTSPRVQTVRQLTVHMEALLRSGKTPYLYGIRR
jgi:hypothetical protein